MVHDSMRQDVEEVVGNEAGKPAYDGGNRGFMRVAWVRFSKCAG